MGFFIGQSDPDPQRIDLNLNVNLPIEIFNNTSMLHV